MVGWKLEKVFYLKATGLIYPRSVAAENSFQWLSITVLGEGAGWAWIRIWEMSLKSYSNQYPSNIAGMLRSCERISLSLPSKRFPSCIKVMRDKVCSLPGCFISYCVCPKPELVLKRQGNWWHWSRETKHISTPVALEAKSKVVCNEQRDFCRLQTPSHEALGSTRVPREPEENIRV